MEYISPEILENKEFILKICHLDANYTRSGKYKKPFKILDYCQGNLAKDANFILDLLHNCKHIPGKPLRYLIYGKDILHNLYKAELEHIYKIFGYFQHNEVKRIDGDGELTDLIEYKLLMLDYIPPDLFNDKEFILSLCQVDKKIIEKTNFTIASKILKWIKSDLFDDKDFALELYKDNFISSDIFTLFSDRLKDDEDVVEKALLNEKCHIDLACVDDFEGELIFPYISERLRDNEKFIIKLMEQGYVYVYEKDFSDRLLNSKLFLLDISKYYKINRTSLSLDFFSEEINNDRELLLKVASMGAISDFPSNFKQDKEIVREIIKNSSLSKSSVLKLFEDDREAILNFANEGCINFREIPVNHRLDKEILLGVSKNKKVEMFGLHSKIIEDVSFLYKMIRYSGQRSMKHSWVKMSKFSSQLENDYFKMGKYETVVKTVLKIGLPIELSRDICKFL